MIDITDCPTRFMGPMPQTRILFMGISGKRCGTAGMVSLTIMTALQATFEVTGRVARVGGKPITAKMVQANREEQICLLVFKTRRYGFDAIFLHEFWSSLNYMSALDLDSSSFNSHEYGCPLWSCYNLGQFNSAHLPFCFWHFRATFIRPFTRFLRAILFSSATHHHNIKLSQSL